MKGHLALLKKRITPPKIPRINLALKPIENIIIIILLFLMRDNPTIRRLRLTLIRKNDSIGIILAWTVSAALEDQGVARVAHEGELEKVARGAVGEVEGLGAVEDPFDGVEGGLGPVFEFVRVGVFSCRGWEVSRWSGQT